MIDAENLTRWLVMVDEIDRQLSQFAQLSAPEDQDRLEEVLSYLRAAKVALLKATGLTEPRKPSLQVLRGGKCEPEVPF